MGFTTITATSIKDISGRPLNGRVTFTGPVGRSGNTVSAVAYDGGPITFSKSNFLVEDGQITTDSFGATSKVVDTANTNPEHIGYTVEFFDTKLGKLDMPGYLCVQPTGSTWSLDTYVANQPNIGLILSGPAGPPRTFLGNYAAGTTYALGDEVHASDGSSYVSLQNGNTGNNPVSSPIWWGLAAAAGAPGASGLSGAQVAAIADADVNVTVNFFDKIRVVSASYIDTMGVIHSYAPGSASAPFRVDGSDHFVTNLPFQTGADGWGMAYFDGFGAFLSFVANPSSTASGVQTWAVPTGAFFARGWWQTTDVAALSFGGKTGLDAAMIVHGTTFPTSYTSFGTYPENVIDAKIAASAASLTTAINAANAQTGAQIALALSSQFPLLTNLFDYRHLSAGGFFIQPGTGVQTSYSDTRFRATWFTRLQPGQWLANFNFSWSPCYYDQNGNWLADAVPGNVGATVNSGTVLTAPAGTYYVRGYVTQIEAAGGVVTHVEASPIITTGTGVNGGIVGSVGHDGGSNSYVPPQNTMIVQGSALPASVVSFFAEDLATTAYADAVGNQLALRPLYGANVMVLGDSTSFYTQWQSYLQSIAGANVSYNCAVPGRVMRDALTGSSGSSIPAVTSTDAMTAKYCVLFLSTNVDTSSGGLNLGSPTDAPSLTSSATVSAQTRGVIEQLLTWNPQLRIVMPLAYQSAYWAGVGVAKNTSSSFSAPTTAGLAITKQVNDALAAVASLYAIPTIDLASIIGVNPFNLAVYSSDGIHLVGGTDPTNPGYKILGNAIVRWLVAHARV